MTIKTFPLRQGTRQGCPLSPLLFDIVFKVLVSAIRQEKEINSICIGKDYLTKDYYVDYAKTKQTNKILKLNSEKKSTNPIRTQAKEDI